MTSTPTVRPLHSKEWRTYRELRLAALADSPDAFGGTFAADADRTDDEWAHRLQQGVDLDRSLPLVAEVHGAPAGLAWGRIDDADPEVAHVYQMWVAPAHRRAGAGQMLLATIIQWAKARDVRDVLLTVTCGDTSAWRLYLRAGFEAVGAAELLRPGSYVLAQPMRLRLRCSSRSETERHEENR